MTGAFPIRRGMDVYNAYQDEYLGAVVKVYERSAVSGQRSAMSAGTSDRAGPRRDSASVPVRPLPASPPSPLANRTGSEQSSSNIGLVHEEGAQFGHTETEGSRMLGEEMGPAPTMEAGNTGPRKQSAAEGYATRTSATQNEVACFAVRPGRINLGPMTRPFYVPTSAILSISMERIVLDVQRDEIPPEWRAPFNDTEMVG